MRFPFFILFLGMAFFYAQSGQATVTPTEGHKLTPAQKEWVQKNRPESKVPENGTNVNCSFWTNCPPTKNSKNQARTK